MMVMNMNSKRTRKPNVRLWEVGDFSAALACTVPKSCKGTLGIEKWLNDPNSDQESKHLQISGQNQLQYPSPVSDVCPRMLEDTQCNRENKDPNSAKPVSGFFTSPKIVIKSKPKLDFGYVKRKARSMKRRRLSEHSSTRPLSTDFKDSSDDVTPSMIKECSALQTGDSEFDTVMRSKSNDFTGKTDTAKAMFHQCASSVEGWLEELGFGTLVPFFEIHEVDEEALLLLTLEDLKEMGIVAVGTRRKLFVAIQQLRDAK